MNILFLSESDVRFFDISIVFGVIVIRFYSSSSFAFKQASMHADHRVSGDGGRVEISICFFV